jgi:hypothetical protein
MPDLELGRELALLCSLRKRLAGRERGSARLFRHQHAYTLFADFLGAVLLRVARQDPLVLNAQAHPPHIQVGKPVNAGGGEGDAIVGADGVRKAVLAEQPVEDRVHTVAFGRHAIKNRVC